MSEDIVDRLRIAETAPLDAGGKVSLFLVLQDARAEIERLRKEPRGWLTEEERETLEDAADAAESWGRPSPSAKVMRALLARSTPTRVPPPPRGWLTAEERETVEKCLRHFVRQEIEFLERNDPGHRWLEVWRREEAILRALLARETPPRVVAPPVGVRYSDTMRHNMWIAAIRAAGGEVE